MSFDTLVSTARALELTQREVAFMKSSPLENATKPEVEQQINHISDRPLPRVVTPAHSCNLTAAPSRKYTTQVCRYCGEKEHVGGHCKARGATCHKCNKRNHFEKVCESKSIHPMSLQHIAEQAPIPEEYSFNSLELKMEKVECSIPELPQPNHTYPSTYTTVRINQHKLPMQIDSGEEANIIDEETFAKLKEGAKLKLTNFAHTTPHLSK